MPQILVIATHPQFEHSRTTRRTLQDAARVAVRDLYALYPDHLVGVAFEQAALAAAWPVVWLHLVHWYSMPPLMKLWLDKVFAFRWAYGPGGHALNGKHL